MTTPLPKRTLHAYRRLTRPLAALMKVTRGKPSGAVGPATLASFNRVATAANRVFSREADIGTFPVLPEDTTLTLIDLTVLVDEIVVAALRFEDLYPEIDPPHALPKPR